jgi:hypothetical protein
MPTTVEFIATPAKYGSGPNPSQTRPPRVLRPIGPAEGLKQRSVRLGHVDGARLAVPQMHMSTFIPELFPESQRAFEHELAVPCCRHCDSRREHAHTVGSRVPTWPIGITQTAEVQPFDARDRANAWQHCSRSVAPGDKADLFGRLKLSNEVFGLGCRVLSSFCRFSSQPSLRCPGRTRQSARAYPKGLRETLRRWK